jgi:hypothetical protein
MAIYYTGTDLLFEQHGCHGRKNTGISGLESRILPPPYPPQGEDSYRDLHRLTKYNRLKIELSSLNLLPL